MTPQNPSNSNRPTGLTLGLALMLVALVSGCGVEQSPAPASTAADKEAALAKAKRFIVSTSQYLGKSTPPMGATPSGYGVVSSTPSGAPTGMPSGSSAGMPSGTQSGTSTGSPVRDCSAERKAYEIAQNKEWEAQNILQGVKMVVRSLEENVKGKKAEIEKYKKEMESLNATLTNTSNPEFRKTIQARLDYVNDVVEGLEEAIQTLENRIAVGREQIPSLEAIYDAAVQVTQQKKDALIACGGLDAI